jgi:hypothetical protein
MAAIPQTRLKMSNEHPSRREDPGIVSTPMAAQGFKSVPTPKRARRTGDLPLSFLAFFHAPWMWLGFSLLVLVLDYLFGPFVHLSVLFFFPVVAAAWHRGLGFGLLLALVLPWFRLMFYFAWGPPWAWVDSGASCLVRAVAFATFAVLTGRLRRQADEIHLLRGLLPICAWCRKIRNDKGTWEPIERFISSKTEARFSHGICPDCLKNYDEASAHLAGSPGDE